MRIGHVFLGRVSQLTANQRVYSENLGELNGCDGDLLGWEIRTNVNHQFLYNFLECVMEISHALQGLAGNWKPGKTAKVVVQGPLMISATRRISTAVRKNHAGWEWVAAEAVR